MGSQQQEGSGLDYRKDQNEQKDNFPPFPLPLECEKGVWDGAHSPQPKFSAQARQRERWKGKESP